VGGGAINLLRLASQSVVPTDCFELRLNSTAVASLLISVSTADLCHS